MKYASLISVIALLGFAACSTDSEPTPQPDTDAEAIVFNCGMQPTEEVSTRAATGLHDVGMNSFRVWAYKNTAVSGNNNYTSYQKVMDGYNVWWETTTTTTNIHSWEYVNGSSQTVKFWDMSANAYRFAAIAPATASHTVSIVGDDTQSLRLTFPVDATDEATIPYYSELWYSTGHPIDFSDKQFGSPVKLQFIKPVAYVCFMFTYEDSNDASTTTLTGKNFKPTDGGLIEQKGDVTVSYPITGTGTAETFSVSPDGQDGITSFTQDFYSTPADANSCKIYTVLPAIDQGTYTLQVSVNGEPKSVVIPAEYMDWLPGHQYTYVFKIRADGGVTIDSVQSAFTPWEIEEGLHTINNW